MSLTIDGTVKAIFDTQTFDSGFSKREFVITTKEQYPQDVKFEVVKDKCSLIDGYRVGQSLTVHFNVRGNEYNGKYYVNLQAWKIEAAQAATPAPVAAAPADGEDGDLPF
jgi:single-strand DNA-binding protein